jgi:hypothetical protein
MEDKQENKFRKLIQKAGTEKPGGNFSRLVMKTVYEEAERELAKEAALRALLQRQPPVETPSVAFRQNVMNQVWAASQKKEEEIISKRIWYLIGAAVVLISLVGYLTYSPAVTPEKPAYFSFLSGIPESFHALPIVYPITLIALSGLIFLDYLLRQNKDNPLWEI